MMNEELSTNIRPILEPHVRFKPTRSEWVWFGWPLDAWRSIEETTWMISKRIGIRELSIIWDCERLDENSGLD